MDFDAGQPWGDICATRKLAVDDVMKRPAFRSTCEELLKCVKRRQARKFINQYGAVYWVLSNVVQMPARDQKRA